MEKDVIPVNAFVAMFDILGFKALRQGLGTADLYRRYSRGILPMIQYAAAGRAKTIKRDDGQLISVADPNEFSLPYIAISDTVLVFAPDDSFDSFLKIVGVSHRMTCTGFIFAPMRGAIGYGDLIHQQQLYVGSAIEDAYQGEQVQAWAGTMLTADCRDFVTTKGYIQQRLDLFTNVEKTTTDEQQLNNFKRAKAHLIEYEVPVQHWDKQNPVSYGKLKTYAFNWSTNVYAGASDKCFEPTTSKHAQRIIDNTKEFEKYLRAKYSEFK